MPNVALMKSVVLVVTNKSGGALAAGDTVVLDTTTATSVTTTTTSGYTAESVGVVVEPNGIANNATGKVCFAGYCPLITLSGSASLGDFFKTHTVAKQSVRHATPMVAGDFGIVLGTGTTPAAYLFGFVNQVSAGSAVGTDTIWDAKGDLVAGTGADAATKLTVGANDTIFVPDSSVSNGLKWVVPGLASYKTAAAQSIPNATVTIINFGTSVYDTDSLVTTGASWKYTVAAGTKYIRVSVMILFTTTTTWAAGEIIQLSVYKNGSLYRHINRFEPRDTSGTSGYECVVGQTDVAVTATDTIDIRVNQGSGAALALHNDGDFNWVAIGRIG